MGIRSHLWGQCETWVWFLAPTSKRICKSQRPAKTPTIISPTSGDSEHSWARKPRAWLYMHLSQARLTTATVLLMDYQIISSRNSSCQTSFQSEEIWLHNSCTHYADVIMTTMESQITSLTVVYSTVYSDADQRKHQSSASLAFVWGIHRDRWIPRTKGQLRGKCFHLMTSSCHYLQRTLWQGT